MECRFWRRNRNLRSTRFFPTLQTQFQLVSLFNSTAKHTFTKLFHFEFAVGEMIHSFTFFKAKSEVDQEKKRNLNYQIRGNKVYLYQLMILLKKNCKKKQKQKRLL